MARPFQPIWTAFPSRFAGLSKAASRGWLAVLALLMILAASALITPGPPPNVHTGLPTSDAASGSAADDDRADVMLYQQIAAGVRGGGNYYAVAAGSQRRMGYPLRPFVTMRLPTLALIQAFLPHLSVLILLYGLAAATALAWYFRLDAILPRLTARAIGLVLLGCGSLICLRADLAPFHEVWAGLLIALSLAMWRPDDWLPAVSAATCAMLIRETAALYAIVMAIMAWRAGNRREVAGWAMGLGILSIAVAAHIYGWSQVVRPADEPGPGWSGLLGFGFFAKTITLLTALAPLPELIGVLLVALALFGWAGLRDPLGTRATAVLAAYAVLVSLFCRTDTYYWSLLVAPVSLIGLAFAPDAVRDLIGNLRDRRRIIVTRTALGEGP